MKKIITIFLYFALSFTSAQSLIKVDITRGNLSPLPLAVSSLSSSENDRETLRKELDIKDIPIITYCAHSKCNASEKLIDSLFDCKVNNI